MEEIKEKIEDVRLNMQATLEVSEQIRKETNADNGTIKTLEKMEEGIQKWIKDIKEIENMIN